jgi:hypothetical protein
VKALFLEYFGWRIHHDVHNRRYFAYRAIRFEEKHLYGKTQHEIKGKIRRESARARREAESVSEPFSNGLTDAEVERLAILSEELGEAQQCIGKILRHGYESYNPVVNTNLTNRRELEREIGDVQAAIDMLFAENDV